MAEFHGRNSFQVLFAMNHSSEFLPILCVAYKNRVVSGPSCNDHIFLAKISCVFEHFSCFFRKHFIYVDGRSVVCEQFLRGQNSYFVKLSVELNEYSWHWSGFPIGWAFEIAVVGMSMPFSLKNAEIFSTRDIFSRFKAVAPLRSFWGADIARA